MIFQSESHFCFLLLIWRLDRSTQDWKPNVSNLVDITRSSPNLQRNDRIPNNSRYFRLSIGTAASSTAPMLLSYGYICQNGSSNLANYIGLNRHRLGGDDLKVLARRFSFGRAAVRAVESI